MSLAASAPSMIGHLKVHRHDVGTEEDRTLDGLLAIRRVADNLDTRFLREEREQRLPEETVVVGDEYADR